ncbi:MAG: ABC transporter ATP-binding protein [Planctomycetes bacterium]|nr:ABC transporter ATP-binding protein [Planctomycetota bacterium]
MTAQQSPIIQTIELTKIYRDFWGRERVKALDGLNLEINPGEVFGLLGPNGSGKTTTVRLILGLLFPTKGVVRLFGDDPRDVDVKRRVGYMPEESHLYDYLNAEETLDFFGRIFGLSRAERLRRTSSLIEMVGLERARHRPIGEFSKGMARRIGLAQALINDPDLLILDEPTTGLDPLGGREIKELIDTLRERGKTIFLCSHLLSDVEQVCDRVCILYGGKIQEMGPVSGLLTESEKRELRFPAVSDEVLDQVRQLVGRHVGGEEKVEVGRPARRLDDVFLAVVERARREKLATAGAEAGGPAAEFLVTEAPEGERLIEELVEAGKKTEEEEEEENVPVPVEESDREDHELLEDLANPEEMSSEEEAEEEPVSATETEPRYDVIEDLMTPEEEESEQQASNGEREEDAE